MHLDLNAARRLWPKAPLDEIEHHVADLLNADDAHTTVLKQDTRSRVALIQADGISVVVKTLRPSRRRMLLGGLDHALRFSQGWREWRGARQLADAGVRCVEPIAITRRHGADLILMPAIDGKTLIDHLAGECDPERRMALAGQIGQQLGRITAAGLINRDHKSRNLLIDEAAADGKAPPLVIDPAGLRQRRRTRQVAKMFALLLETAGQTVTRREAMRCLHEAQWIDPTLVGLRSLIDAAYRAKLGRAHVFKDASGR